MSPEGSSQFGVALLSLVFLLVMVVLKFQAAKNVFAAKNAQR